MQISQRSHGLLHWVTCVQAGHLAGLPKSAAVQVAASRVGVGAPGTTQQPKQSQPFGTNLRQKLMQAVDCDDDTEHSAACWVAYCWSYGHFELTLIGSHLSCHSQWSSPAPELPSKKQSCL